MLEMSESSQKQREYLMQFSRISNLLDTGLDNRSLYICIRLIEAGVHPECLADIIKQLCSVGANIAKKERAASNVMASRSQQSKWKV